MATCKLCPVRRHCHDNKNCEGCALAKALEGHDKKIKKLKSKNEALQIENEELKEQIECLKNPNF